MIKRNVLGKGIAAIISNEPVSKRMVVEIDLDLIYPNPAQPRKYFSKERIEELADSMKESGVIQPIIVFKKDEKYYLIVGERRWRAARLLKWEKIPAIVRDVTEKDIIADSLIENVQRENLNPLEIANGIEELIRKTGLSHQEVGDKLGMSRVAVTNFLRLLRLPVLVKEWITSRKIDQGHARALLSLESDAEIQEMATLVVEKNLSVRQIELLVKNKVKRTFKQGSNNLDPNVNKIEDKLAKLFSTKVKIQFSKNGKGKLTIFFSSVEEFQRVYSILNKE